MKNHSIVLLFLGLVLMFTSCDKELNNISPSTTITKEERSISGFNRIDVSAEFEVFVTFSDTKEEVIVEANENLQDLIILEKKGKELNIRLKDNTSIKGNETMKIHITAKEIIDYRLTGESSVTLKNELKTDKISIEITGESLFTGTVNLKELSADITGESKLNLSGIANTLSIKLSGDSQIRDYDFVCNQLDIALSGESQAFLTVVNKIEVDASGESVLHYKGEANITSQNLSGEAKIKKED